MPSKAGRVLVARATRCIEGQIGAAPTSGDSWADRGVVAEGDLAQLLADPHLHCRLLPCPET